jgi:hypothetical protein
MEIWDRVESGARSAVELAFALLELIFDFVDERPITITLGSVAFAFSYGFLLIRFEPSFYEHTIWWLVAAVPMVGPLALVFLKSMGE